MDSRDDNATSEHEVEDTPQIENLQEAPAFHPHSKYARPPGMTKNQWSTAKKRSKRHNERAEAQVASGRTVKACSLKYRQHASPYAMSTTINVDDDLANNVTLPAWVGRQEVGQDWSEYGLLELQNEYGMALYNWNGT